MADFFVNLWESVFTPGTTPTLLIATNTTFAALQLVLLGLLAATHSIHFVILSFLSAGVWGSINWFVHEVEAVKAREKEEVGANKAREARQRRDGLPEESETETEDASPQPKSSLFPPSAPLTLSSGRSLAVQSPSSALKKRLSLSDMSGTDSEWDKVSENDGSRDK